jgi:hypothetical protein
MPTPNQADGPPPAGAAAPWYRRPLFWGVLAALVAAAVLLALWWPGCESRTAGPASGSQPSPLELQQAVNQGLAEQVRRMKEALAGDVCGKPHPLHRPLDQAPLPGPAGRVPAGTEEGQGPQTPSPAQPGTQAAPQEQARPPDEKAEAQGEKPPSLATLLEMATALVIGLVPDRQSITSGTAFFVAPDLLLTNRHVVAPADPQRIMVTSRALGQARQARVLAQSSAPGRDYALLQIVPQAGDRPRVLALCTKAEKLENTVAAGYPMLLTQDDPKFRALLEGKATDAVPELIFSQGVVSVVFERQPPVIAHTAVLSQGNSGGPLVDRCGRILGINTMIKRGTQSLHQGNYALSASDVVQFLRAQGVQPKVVERRCPQS